MIIFVLKKANANLLSQYMDEYRKHETILLFLVFQ